MSTAGELQNAGPPRPAHEWAEAAVHSGVAHLVYVRWLEARLVASGWLEQAQVLMASESLTRRRAGLRFKARGVVVFDRILCGELERLEMS